MDYNFDFQQDRPRPRTITLRKFTLLFAVDTQTTNALWSEIIWEVKFLFFSPKYFLPSECEKFKSTYSFWMHEALVNDNSTLEGNFPTTVNSVWQTTFKQVRQFMEELEHLCFSSSILMST